MPCVESEWYGDRQPRLYFPSNNMDENSLSFEMDDYQHYYEAEINMRSKDVKILSIHGVEGRVHNPDLDFDVHLSRHTGSSQPATFNFQIRCDGDNNGVFEYIIYFHNTTYQLNRYPNIAISSKVLAFFGS